MKQEIIGMVGSGLVVTSFLFNNQKVIRIVNAIGGLFLIIYGILINSASNIVLNSVLTVIHLVKLHKMRKE